MLARNGASNREILAGQLLLTLTTKEAVEPNEVSLFHHLRLFSAAVRFERYLESPSLTFPPSLASFKKRSIWIAFLLSDVKGSYSRRSQNLPLTSRDFHP